MKTKHSTPLFYAFLIIALMSLVAIAMKERDAFLICGGVADVLGIILFANTLIKIRRERT